jgi:uncharacterized protein
VRYEPNDLARLELPLEALPLATEPPIRERITAELRRLGFRAVTIDLEGFRSGSFNQLVPIEALQTVAQNLAHVS